MAARSEKERTGRESQGPQIPRRLLLKAAGTAIVGGGILGSLRALLSQKEKEKQPEEKEGYTEQNEAEEFFHVFPLEIPGAASVEKFSERGAKHCLIHIRQLHLVEGREQDPEEILQRVHQAQDDIYEILAHLIEHQGLQEVYGEAEDSMTVGAANVIQSLKQVEKLV